MGLYKMHTDYGNQQKWMGSYGTCKLGHFAHILTNHDSHRHAVTNSICVLCRIFPVGFG
jgi:hypothetical protein